MKQSLLIFGFLNLFLRMVFSLPSKQIIDLSNYNYPKPVSSPFVERIAILATNDIHGHILPTIQFFPFKNQTYRTGGLTLMSTYIDALKEEWGDNLLWLDAGDEFQGSKSHFLLLIFLLGTIESNDFFGEPIIKFFNYKNISGKTGSAIGNHDFDFGFQNMSNQFLKADFPHLAANVYNRSTESVWNFTNTFPHQVFRVGRLKVGVIGLTTMNTPHTTSFNVSGLEFKDHVNITIEKSRSLKAQGVDIILLVAHVGVICKTGKITDNHFLTIRHTKSKVFTKCSENDELYAFLNQLPAGTLDGVIGGHKHTIVHHWLNNIPVVIGECNAKHFNVLYLTYDMINKKVIHENTKIEGPVPVCETMFHTERTCYTNHTEGVLDENIDFLNISFHGKVIHEDLGLKDYLHIYLEKAEKQKEDILGYIAHPMLNSNEEESDMGNFATDAIRKHCNSDVALLNHGTLRVTWQQGVFSAYDLYETFPFEDKLVTFDVTGQELISIVKILQEGYLGFYFTSGLQQNVCGNPHSLINVTLDYGVEINPFKNYTIGTVKFMAMGGDDFASVLKVYSPRNLSYHDNLREVIREAIIEEKILNENGKQYIDPENRRLIVHDCKKIEIPTNYIEIVE